MKTKAQSKAQLRRKIEELNELVNRFDLERKELHAKCDELNNSLGREHIERQKLAHVIESLHANQRAARNRLIDARASAASKRAYPAEAALVLVFGVEDAINQLS